jgi:hypothetical protein
VTLLSYELTWQACGSWRVAAHPPLSLRLCAGPRLTFMQSASRDLRVRNEGALEPLLYALARPEVALALGEHSALWLGAGLGMALLRPRFVLHFEAERSTVLTLAC